MNMHHASMHLTSHGLGRNHPGRGGPVLDLTTRENINSLPHMVCGKKPTYAGRSSLTTKQRMKKKGLIHTPLHICNSINRPGQDNHIPDTLCHHTGPTAIPVPDGINGPVSTHPPW
jgi:hypothetical protein